LIRSKLYVPNPKKDQLCSLTSMEPWPPISG